MTAPTPVWEVINGFGAYWALNASLDLGLFDALETGPATTAELTKRLGAANQEDIELLLQFLTSLGLIESNGTEWSPTPVAIRYLVSTSPMSMVDLVRLSPGAVSNWTDLGATIRTGRPGDQQLARTDALHPAITAATAPTQRAVAAGVAGQLFGGATRHEDPITIVDLGCGSGAWLQTLLGEATPGSRGLGVDLPHVIDAFGPDPGSSSIDLIAGDYLDVDLPVRDVDIVVLAHVLRAEPASRAESLVQRAFELLRPGGTLVVADYFVPPPGRTSDHYRAARHDLTLALTMRAGTLGRGLGGDQLSAWCRRHGGEPGPILEPIPRQTVHLFTHRIPYP